MVSVEIIPAMAMRDMLDQSPRERSISRLRVKRSATFSETGVMFTGLISWAGSP